MAESLFIGESPGDLRSPPTGWIWIKPSTGEVFQYINYAWEKVPITFDKVEVKHLEVTDTLEVPGGEGIDAEVVVGTTTLRFSKGVLYEVEGE